MSFNVPPSPEEMKEVLTARQMWRRIEDGRVNTEQLFTLADKNGNPVKKMEDRNGTPTEVTYTCIFVKKPDEFLQVSILPTRGNIVEWNEDHTFLQRETDLAEKAKVFGGAGFIPAPTILPDEPDMEELNQEGFADLEHIDEMERSPSKPLPEAAPAVPAPSVSEAPRPKRVADMDPSERERLEKEDTIRAFLRATSELIDPSAFPNDPVIRRKATAFLGEAVSRFNSLGINAARIQALGKNGFEKTDPNNRGVTLSRLTRSARGEKVGVDPEDPHKRADALVIRVYHSSQLVQPNETVPSMEKIGRQINTIAACRFQLENINRGENTPFLQLLKDNGIDEVEVRVESWRYRTIDHNGKQDNYCTTAPLIGCNLKNK